MKTNIILFTSVFLLLACKSDSSDTGRPVVEAKFVLPYPVGKSFTCSLGFNTYSHVGSFTYSVDFTMPIGTLVTAARSGRIVYILERYSDDDQTSGHENVVVIRHDDTTYSRYAHLTLNGALVSLNQTVAAGDTVGLSGSSGTNGGPHLHFDVTRANTGRNDRTIPFDFKNTIPHPVGLQRGASYVALPY